MSATLMGPAMPSFVMPNLVMSGSVMPGSVSSTDGSPARTAVRVPSTVARPAAARRPAARPAGGSAPASAVVPGAHLRLTARGRAVLWILVAVVAAVATLVGSRAAVADGPVGAQEVVRHVVQPGETLWQIAASVAAPSEDVRDVVLDLVRLNQLPDAGLMAGQVIVVPVD